MGCQNVAVALSQLVFGLPYVPELGSSSHHHEEALVSGTAVLHEAQVKAGPLQHVGVVMRKGQL